jgi:hypothetical protein
MGCREEDNIKCMGSSIHFVLCVGDNDIVFTLFLSWEGKLHSPFSLYMLLEASLIMHSTGWRCISRLLYLPIDAD